VSNSNRSNSNPSTKAPPMRPGRGAVRRRLGEILRVDHAGELGAVHIYRGQRAVFAEAPGRERMTETLADMEAHEQVHLARFDRLLTDHQVRPTLLAPLWRAAGFALGASTALLGEKAAHACTEAVENVIEEHYAGQIAELETREPALAAELSQFRDDELAHRDTAVAEGAHEAPGYDLLSSVIRLGCRAAIMISEKV
jgi:ubiquinone biosynthesis monooxygenase Coq7